MMRSTRHLAFASIVVAASANAQQAMPRQPVPTGALVRQVCAGCHGPDGNSVRAGVPSLAGQVAAYLEAQLHAFAAQGGQRANGVMGAIAVNLSAEEMKRVAAHFACQTLHPRPLFNAPRRGQPEAQTIFFSGLPDAGVASCASCHGSRGEGLPDRFPRLAGQHQRYIAEQLRHFRAGTRTSDPEAMMRKLAAHLSDHQIDALSTYVARLR